MDTIIDILREDLPGLQALYVFGSRVQGRATPESDWDVAFLISFDNRVDPVARWKLQEKLAAALNADVDLVDLRLASDVIRFEIVSTGIRIFCENVDSCAEFEMYTYSFYHRLQQERKLILEDIIKRGSVYG